MLSVSKILNPKHGLHLLPLMGAIKELRRGVQLSFIMFPSIKIAYLCNVCTLAMKRKNFYPDYIILNHMHTENC